MCVYVSVCCVLGIKLLEGAGGGQVSELQASLDSLRSKYQKAAVCQEELGVVQERAARQDEELKRLRVEAQAAVELRERLRDTEMQMRSLQETSEHDRCVS